MTPTTYYGIEMRDMPQSTNVAAYGYGHGVLLVLFRSGGLYAYRGVPDGLVADMSEASSVGKFVQREVVGRYDYRLVGPEERTVAEALPAPPPDDAFRWLSPGRRPGSLTD